MLISDWEKTFKIDCLWANVKVYIVTQFLSLFQSVSISVPLEYRLIYLSFSLTLATVFCRFSRFSFLGPLREMFIKLQKFYEMFGTSQGSMILATFFFFFFFDQEYLISEMCDKIYLAMGHLFSFSWLISPCCLGDLLLNL